MFKYIRNKIITIREVAGVDMHLLPEDKIIFSGALLKLAGGKVVTVSNIERVKTIDELKKHIPANLPVILSVNGVGILMRNMPAGNNNNVIENLLVGSNPNEFYHSLHKVNNEKNIAFIIRKKKIEEIINLFENKGFRLISLSIGTKSIEYILPFINTEKITFTTPTITIDVIDQKVWDVNTCDNSNNQVYPEVSIGEIYYRTSQSIGVGNALKVLHRPADRIDSDIRTSEILYLQKDYIYYKLFRFTTWAVLITTLILLFINFFVFNHYFHENKEMSKSNSLALSHQEQNVLAGERLDSSYSFFLRSGWNKNTRYGYYIDRIAALVPLSVSFTSLDVAPLQESLGVNDYHFLKNKILISGLSNNPTELETFSRALKNIEGVENVSLNNYSYKPDINAAVFTIEILIKT